MMKRTIGTAAILAFLATPAFAQDATFADLNCVANVGALDTNGDGMVDATESPQYNTIRVNVDVNNDGMITAEEAVVACKSSKLNKALRARRK